MPGAPQWVRAALLGDRLTPDVTRAILSAYTALAGGTDAAGALTLAAIERVYLAGGVEAVVALLFDPVRVDSATAGLRITLNDALNTSALWYIDALPRFRRVPPLVPPGRFAAAFGGGEPTPILRVRFDALNPRAIEAARRLTLDTAALVTQEAKDGVRAAIADAVARGINPRETARVIRGSVGLTAYDRQIIGTYRRALVEGDANALERVLRDRRYDPTVRRALAGGKALTGEQVDTYVAAYERKLLAWRAETQSRTATLDALREGQRLAWEQAIASGSVAREDLRRFWKTAGDDSVRDDHREVPLLNPDGVGFDEPFTTPWGAVMQPGEGPPHETYNCRCVLYVRPVIKDNSGAVVA